MHLHKKFFADKMFAEFRQNRKPQNLLPRKHFRLYGITLLSVVGKVFCKILNDCLVQHLDKSGKIHEGQAGFLAGTCI